MPSTESDESRFVFQEQDTTPEPAEDSFAGIGFWDLARMLFILGIVIVVIYLFFNILKRSTVGRVNSGENIRMLGSRALPGNKSLHVVQIGNHVFFVGAGESAVSLISEITDRETLDELRLTAEEAVQPARRSFSEMLGSVLRPAGDGVGSFDFMHRQRERLRKMR